MALVRATLGDGANWPKKIKCSNTMDTFLADAARSRLACLWSGEEGSWLSFRARMRECCCLQELAPSLRWSSPPQRESHARTTVRPSKSTSWHLSEEIQNTNLKRSTHPCVCCSIIDNSGGIEATYASISRWIKKMWYMYANGILLSCKKRM